MGQVFRKHILNEGTLVHPRTGERIAVTPDFMTNVVRNFEAGIGDIVQVPLANDANQHVESPAANLGEVVGLEHRDHKLYALVDARQDADRFGKTYLGASAFLSTNYTNTNTGEKAGPTLLHVAVTNRPYVTNLEDYEPVAASMADYDGDDLVVLMPPEDDMPQTRDELIAALKALDGTDVEALESRAARAGDTSELTAALTRALETNGMPLSRETTEGGVTSQDMIGAVAELAQLSNAQQEQITGLLRKEAQHEVRGYIKVGRLMPKAEDRAVNLILSGDRAGLEDFLAPASEPYVRLASADGIEGDTSEGQTRDIEGEVARLTNSEHTSRYFTANGTTKR
jgi:hypothetical protein